MGHQRRRGGGLGWWAVAVAVVSAGPVAQGRRVIVNGVVTDDDANGPPAFVLRKQPAGVTEAIEDFERYRDHKAWEKAFAALAKVAEGNGGADRLVVPPGGGLAMPASAEVRRQLLTLPPDGRQAYRLFNDPKAQQLFARATVANADDPTVPPVDDVPLLRQIVDQYFITSVGDQAADRLGDALFERGDFAAAEGCWRSVADDFPDSSIPPALLQAKRAAALAAGGRWGAFAAVRSAVRDRYAGQAVHVGGRDVDAAAFVDGLDRRAATLAATATTRPAEPPLVMPGSAEPAWQVPLLDAGMSKQIEDRLVMYGWGRLAGQLIASVPPTAADEHRCYVNWLGCCMAVDLTTGKLLWRTVSPGAVATGITQGVMQGNVPQPTGYAVVVAGDRVLFVGRAPPTGNGNNGGSDGNANMICLAAADGKRLWSTSDSSLKQWNIVGPPVLAGDGTAYVVAADGQKGEYSLVTVALADGAVKSKVGLGTPQFPTDQFRGNTMPRPPAIVAHDGEVYVLTNDGATIAVNPAAGRLDWALTYPGRVESSDNYYYNYAVPPAVLAPGAMLVSGDTLYVKEYGTATLFAVDLTAPAVRWQRPVDADAGLVGLSADGGTLFLVGTSAEAIATDGERAMRWADPLSVGTGDVRPALAGGHLYAFGKRGVHDVALADGAEPAGSPFHGADKESTGGAVLRAGGRLITVSNMAVTAYPLGPLGPTGGGH